MKWSVGKKIGAGFGLAVLALVVIGGVAYRNTVKLTETAGWVSRTRHELEQLERLFSLVQSAQRGERGYIITGDEQYLEPYTSALPAIEQVLAETRRLADETEQARRLDRLEPEVRAELAELKKGLELRRDQGLEAAVLEVKTGEGRKAMEAIRAIVNELRQFEEDRLKKRTDEAEEAAAGTRYTIIYGALFTALAMAAVGFAITRNVSGPLREFSEAAGRITRGDFSVTVAHDHRGDEIGGLARTMKLMVQKLSALIGQVQKSGIQVNTSATEIAASSKEQQATATETLSTTMELTATSKEIAATAQQLVKTMKEVAEIAEETAGLASTGQSGLARMEESIRKIMDASGSINARLTVLSEKAGNINTVVTTIAKVADQTNLLSLNAAIEAEKAGEFGRGFAVVATEIRRLADQTAGATADIEQMVKEMQSAVSAGVMGMDKFSEEVRRGVEVVTQVSQQLVQIIQQVQTLTPNFESVNEGVQSQAVGAQQISEALVQLGEGARQTVEALRQANLAIEQLNEATTGLRAGVSSFKVEAA